MTVEGLVPKVLISNCIEHGASRYDGSMIGNAFVKKLKDFVTFIPVCPEVAIGLPIPREAIRIVKEGQERKLVHSRSGDDVTLAMTEFSQTYCENLKKQNIHGAIMKSRSPSCGVKDVKMYKSIGKSPSLGEKTSGYFGGTLMAYMPDLVVEDEGRLTNFNIREHFLTRIYTMADFDQVKEEGTIKSLIKFQSRHKYLLMAYHQSLQKTLGALVANHEHLPIETVLVEYEKGLAKALANPLRHGRNTNMLLHIFGYFKDDLLAEEKAYFLDLLSQYNEKKVPFSVPLSLLGAWVIRYDEKYLKGQSIFEPFPKGIIDVTDSGKGID